MPALKRHSYIIWVGFCLLLLFLQSTFHIDFLRWWQNVNIYTKEDCHGTMLISRVCVLKCAPNHSLVLLLALSSTLAITSHTPDDVYITGECEVRLPTSMCNLARIFFLLEQAMYSHTDTNKHTIPNIRITLCNTHSLVYINYLLFTPWNCISCSLAIPTDHREWTTASLTHRIVRVREWKFLF